MLFYERGDVRIRYKEAGSGFPLLVTPGGGLNSRLNYWPNSVINAFEAFQSDFRCITMDQRNANEGESTGPLAIDDPWGGFAEDQLGLMDHLGIDKFAYWPEDPDVMYRSGKEIWAPALQPNRPDITDKMVDQYLHNLYRLNPDFLYSVSRDFIAGCKTPILVLPDNTPAHPHQTSVDVASLAPNAEITVFPWTEPVELKARTMERVRSFLKTHTG